MNQKLIRFVASITILLLVFASVGIPNVESKEKQDYFLLLENTTSLGLSVSRSIVTRTVFNKDSFEILSTMDGILFQLEGCSYRNTDGMPMLPVFEKTIQIKPNETVSNITTTFVDAEKIDVRDLPLLFSPKEIPIFELSPENRLNNYLLIDKHISSEEQNTKSISQIMCEKKKNTILAKQIEDIYPEKNTTYSLATNDGERNLVLKINPIYIKNGFIYFANRINFRIDFSITKEKEIKDTKKNSSVILTPNELFEQAKDLAEMQEEAGFTTEIIQISQIQEYDQAEKPELTKKGFLDFDEEDRKVLKKYDYRLAFKIRTMLQKKLQNDEIDYLTILGDASYVPPSYYEFSSDLISHTDQWVPTDVYYVSPFLKKNEFNFGISVGRLPVKSVKEAKEQIIKLRLYRNALKKNEKWVNSVSLFSGNPFREDYFGELATSRAINKDLFNGMEIHKNYQTVNKFTTEEFSKTLAEGTSSMIWAFGHGSGSGFYLEDGAVTAKDLHELPEKSNLPIIVSEACGNGAWDSRLIAENEKETTESFGEAMLSSKGAGIAYVGGARVNYARYYIVSKNGIPTIKGIGCMDKIIEDYFTAFSKKDGVLGDWVRDSLYTYFVDEIEGSYWISSGDTKTFFGMTLLGDPTISIPFPEETEKFTQPEISIDKEFYESFNEIPYFSIDDHNGCSIKSTSPTLTYIYADYENQEDSFISSGDVSRADGEDYGKTLDFLKKAIGTIRFETKDKKEKRVVFSGRYNYDAVLYEQPDFSLIRPSEKRIRRFNIVNEGIETIELPDFEVEINGKNIIQNQYPIITRNSVQTVSVEYQFEPGLYEIKANLNMQEEEIPIEDNSIVNKVEVTEKPLYRIGVLMGTMFNPDAPEEILLLSKINKHFKEKELNIEVVPVSNMIFENGDVSFELLGFNALILFDILWFSNNLSHLSKSLNQFVDRGGKILGISPIDRTYEVLGLSLAPLQSFFGIKPDANIVCSVEKDENCCFSLKQPLSRFSKNEYNICNYLTMVPSDEKKGVQNWTSVYLLDGAKVLGNGEQKGLTYIQYKENIFFYTGFMIKQSFESKPDTFLLMCDMIEHLEESFSNVEIKKAYRTEQNNLHVGNKVDWVIEVTNFGSEKAENIDLIVGENETIPVGSLYGGQTKEIIITKELKKIGTETFNVKVRAPQNSNKKDSSVELKYFVNEQIIDEDSLFVKIEKEGDGDYLISKEDQLLIKGYGISGSKIKVGTELIPVNADGTFEYLASKEKNGTMISFAPTYQDIEKEPLQVPIKWLQKKDVYLQINDSNILEDGQLKKIDSPPLIVNGRTVISISMVSDCFNAKISWDGKTQTIYIEYMSSKIKLSVGKTEASITKNGKTEIVNLSTPPTIINGRTMVPLRFIAESFGAKIDWEGKSQVITLSAFVEEVVSEEQTYSELLNENKQPECVFSSRNDLLGYIIDFQETEEGLFLATRVGIKHYKDDKLVSSIPYPEGLFNKRFGIDRDSGKPDHSFFTINMDYIVINDGSTIYVINRKTNTIQNKICRESNRLSLVYTRRYGIISDMSIIDSKLYLLDKYEGIRIFDLSSCKELFNVTIMDGFGFPEYIVQMGDYIVGTMKYDGLFTYNMKNHKIHECHFDSYLRHPMLVKKSETDLKLFTKYAEYCDITLNEILTNDILPIEIEEFIELDLARNCELAQMIYGEYGSKNYAILFFGTDNKNPLFKTEFVTINEDLTEYSEFIEGADKEYRRTKNLVPNADNVRIIPSLKRYISEQSLPGNPVYLLYSTNGKVRKYKTNYADSFSEFTVNDAWGGDRYSLFNAFISLSEDRKDIELNIGLDICDFSTEKPKSEKFHKMEFGKGDYAPSSYSFNEDTICIYDGYKCSLLWFDMDSGKMDKRQYFSDQEIIKPISGLNLQFDDQKIYFLDYLGRGIYSATKESNSIDRIDLSQLIQHSQIGNMIVEGDKIYFLDYLNSQIGICADGIFQNWLPSEDFGVECIRSFDVSNGEILINDAKTGNVTKQLFNYDSDRIVSNEQIHGFKEEVKSEFYPNEKSKSLLSLYIDVPFKNLKIETSDGIIFGDYLQKQSQVLSYSIDYKDGIDKNQEITINVDGFTREIKINCENKELFATFYNDSIFTDTWCGVKWKTAEASVKNGRLWIDADLMEDVFDCDIRIKKETITIIFDSIKLEAIKGNSFYIYENEDGQRYKRDGTMLKQNKNGDYIVNPSVYIEMKDGEKIVEENLIQIIGKNLFKLEI
ncbi:MAG: hypothetical protein KAH01_07510 [Caldisericia bacterium]|nr:hypothetical protein [Caldisericia bacterium]